ncbi:MAG: SDR family oxidoreductase [bacterium]|nr:SDR family oxidoreductase [bacterium]
MFDLTGRTIVVTGGNGGIGKGLARGVARAGAQVAIWARNEQKNEHARSELEALGAKVISVPCDIAKEEDILSAIEQTASQLGRIDACFANAGYGSRGDPLEISLEQWRELLSVNLDGTFLTLRCVANHMIEHGGSGKLIVTSSMVERFGSPMEAQYAASKAAVGSLVKTFAVRLAQHDIQVNSIEPGWVVTDVTARLSQSDEFNKILTKRIPARRWGDPTDFEGIAVYLASDESRYHTGDAVLIDGGYSVF